LSVTLRKNRTWLFAVLLIGSLLSLLVTVGGFLMPLLPTKPSVTEYPPQVQGLSAIYGNRYTFDTPIELAHADLLFGNVTLCCRDSPSGGYNGPYVPYLFILSTAQLSLWTDQSGPPKAYSAQTAIGRYENYSFSGRTRSEALTFSMYVIDSGVYHILVFQQGMEQATLYLKVLSMKPDQNYNYAITGASIIAAVLFLAGTVMEFRKRK
jgi:hypothetical protein